MYTSNLQARAALSLDEVARRAPSAFAQAPQVSKVSDRYEFIPTTKVIDLLGREGWMPVQASQSRARTLEGKDFAKHVITFQNALVSKIGNDTPELVLTNSHNGLSAFNIYAGLFRMVCSNGLVVCDANFGQFSIKHVGFKAGEVIDASYKIIEQVPLLAESVNKMRDVQLDRDEQAAFAKSCLLVKYDDADKAPISPEQLLLTRRSEDRDGSLWSTFNAVQENLTKGGLRGVSVNERGQRRRTRTRAIGSVQESVRVNKALWTLAEEMRKLKVG